MDPVEYDIKASGYSAAFRTAKSGKNVFLVLLVVAVLVQMASVLLVQFAPIFEGLAPAGAVAASQPAAQPTTQPASQPAGSGIWPVSNETLMNVMKVVMSASKFMGFVLGLLLVVSILLAVQLSLLGRLGGIVGFVRAFYWSLVLLAVLTPWQQVLYPTQIHGALFNLQELLSGTAAVKKSWGGSGELMPQIWYYARFIAYPIVALLIALVVQLKFARGYKDSALGTLPTTPTRPSEMDNRTKY